MNKRAALATLLAAGLIVPFLGGCQTLTETPGENANRVGHTMSTDMREVPDDFEYLLLLRRPSQMTNKPVTMR